MSHFEAQSTQIYTQYISFTDVFQLLKHGYFLVIEQTIGYS